jgi:hypothetical protein
MVFKTFSWKNSVRLIGAFLALTLCIGLSGCSKGDKPEVEPPDTYYYIRFKVDGVEIEHKDNTLSIFNKDTPEDFNFSGGASTADLTLSDAFVFYLENHKSGDPLIYTNTERGNDSPYVRFNFYPSKSIPRPFMYISSIFLDLKYKRDARLTVTELTAEYVKGTFSGTVYSHDDYSDNPKWPSKFISDGRFYLPRVNN